MKSTPSSDSSSPQADNAERGLIGAILINSGILEDVESVLEPRDFRQTDLGDIYASALRLLHQGETIDPISLSEEGHDLVELTGIMADTPHSLGAMTYANQIKDASSRRAAIQAATRVAQAAYNTGEEFDPTGAIKELEALEVTSRQGVTSADELASLLWDKLDKIQKGEEAASHSTPWEPLTQALGGIVVPEFIVMAARPSMGKTQVAVHFVDHYSRNGKKVLVHSMDTTDANIVNRWAIMKSGVNWMEFRQGVQSPTDEAKYGQALADLMGSGSNTGVIDRRIKIDEFVRAAKAYARRVDGLDLIVVDYMQQYPVSGRNRVAEMGEIAEKLKDLGKELGTPVLALSQLSRAIESRRDKRPKMDDIRESGGIEQAADVIIGLYRPKYYDKADGSGDIEMEVLKHRDGERGNVARLYFDRSTLRIMRKG